MEDQDRSLTTWNSGTLGDSHSTSLFDRPPRSNKTSLSIV